MDENIVKMLEIIDEIKQDITDKQYKILMESLMNLHKYKTSKQESLLSMVTPVYL